MALIYHGFPTVTKRSLNDPLAYTHFWISYVGIYLILLPAHFETFPGGQAGMPRRYLDYSNWGTFDSFNNSNRFFFMVTAAVLIVQVIFLFNIFYSLVKGKRVVKNQG
jgi:cytochrome c oxidase subunit 1